MKIEKPVTDNMKQRVNTLYLYMKSIYPTPITKEKVCEVCGVKSTRQARDMLSVLAQRKPLISTSDSKGYPVGTYKGRFGRSRAYLGGVIFKGRRT